MARVIVSPFAVTDQDEILGYLAPEAGLVVAEKYDAAFRAAAASRGFFQGSGRRFHRSARASASA
jgi:plasmid stabilization system protein ParE